MVNKFVDCAKNINYAWERVRFERAAFSDIAVEQLEQSRLLLEADPNDIVHWLMRSEAIPCQNTYEFGQPPIIVYSDTRFYIQVLFWLDATTSIHQHAFSGAFGVFSGSSVHSSYCFQPSNESFSALMPGRLHFQGAELLAKGDVRPIFQGGSTHALFHLDRPSVSVVVRTPGSSEIVRQYNYLQPALAIDPSYNPALETIQLRMLEALLKTNVEAFWNMTGLVIQSADPWMLFKTLSLAFRKVEDGPKWQSTVAIARERWPDYVDAIIETLHTQDAEARIISLRTSIHDATHRFFLALLLNVPSRQLIYQFIAERFPSSDPESLVLRWLGEIFKESRCGMRLTPLTLHLLKMALHNPDFENAKPTLHNYIRSCDDEQKLRNTWGKLMALNLLRPLFQNGAIESYAA